jgi:MFS family permease
MVVRCLMGVVNSPLHPGAANMVALSVPRSQTSLANGLVTFAACVGMAATYFLFGKLMDLLGWPGAFYVSSGFTVLVFLAWVGLAPRPAPQAGVTRSPAKPAVHVSDFFAHPGLICLTLSYAALGYFQYLFFYWMEYYFESVLQLGKERSRLYSTLVVLASGLGMVLGGWLTDCTLNWRGRGGRALVPVAGLLTSAVVLIAGLWTAHAQLTLLCFAGAMAALGMCEGPFWTTAVEIGGHRGGMTAALMNTGGNAGGLLAPVVTPSLSLYFGWQVGMGLASVVVVLGAILWLGIDPHARLAPSEPTTPAPDHRIQL